MDTKSIPSDFSMIGDSVIFQSIESDGDNGIRCFYTVDSTQTPKSSDRIAIYSENSVSSEDYVCFKWAPVPKRESPSNTFIVEFKADVLPDIIGDYYQACYLTHEGDIVGSSDFFNLGQFETADQIEEDRLSTHSSANSRESDFYKERSVSSSKSEDKKSEHSGTELFLANKVLKAQIDNHNKKKDELQATLADKEKIILMLEEKSKRESNASKLLQKSNAKLEARVANLFVQLDDMKKKMASLEDEKGTSEERCVVLEKDNLILKNKMAAMKRNLDYAKEDLKESDKKKVAAEKIATDLSQRLQRTRFSRGSETEFVRTDAPKQNETKPAFDWSVLKTKTKQKSEENDWEEEEEEEDFKENKKYDGNDKDDDDWEEEDYQDTNDDDEWDDRQQPRDNHQQTRDNRQLNTKKVDNDDDDDWEDEDDDDWGEGAITPASKNTSIYQGTTTPSAPMPTPSTITCSEKASRRYKSTVKPKMIFGKNDKGHSASEKGGYDDDDDDDRARFVQCPVCSKMLDISDHLLEEHINSHSEVTCPVCNQSFPRSSQEKYEQHVNSHFHDDDDSQKKPSKTWKRLESVASLVTTLSSQMQKK